MANGIAMDWYSHAYFRMNFLVPALEMLKASMMRERHWPH
jgi:hypothetical protein